MSAHIFKPRYRDEPGDSAFCRQAIHDGGRWPSYHQCNRKPVVFRCVDGAEYGFCKQHDPEAVARRYAERDAKWRAEWGAKDAARDREKQERSAGVAAKAALEQIAAGHNDPRTLAAEVLAMYPALSPLPAAEETR